LAWVREGPINRFSDPGKSPDYPRDFSEDKWLEKGRSLPQVAEALIALLAREDLEHPSLDGGRLAVALGVLGGKRKGANEVLLRALESKSETVRREAAIGLKTQGDSSALASLERHLLDMREEPNVRINACEAIVAIGASTPSSKRTLRAVLKDADWLVAKCANEALGAPDAGDG
jgi:HEAT repeat protein